MSFCPKCGFNLDQEDKFCRKCGQSVQLTSEVKTTKTNSTFQNVFVYLFGGFLSGILSILFSGFCFGFGAVGLLIVDLFSDIGAGTPQLLVYGTNLFWIMIVIGVIMLIVGIWGLNREKKRLLSL